MLVCVRTAAWLSSRSQYITVLQGGQNCVSLFCTYILFIYFMNVCYLFVCSKEFPLTCILVIVKGWGLVYNSLPGWVCSPAPAFECLLTEPVGEVRDEFGPGA